MGLFDIFDEFDSQGIYVESDEHYVITAKQRKLLLDYCLAKGCIIDEQGLDGIIADANDIQDLIDEAHDYFEPECPPHYFRYI